MTAALNNALGALDADGRTGLHHAVLDRDLDVLRAAIGAGADVSTHDSRGWTPLHFAAQMQDAEACRLLLAAGADVNAKDDNGNTPLWRAVFEARGRTIVVELLLGAKADPSIKNDHGVSARDLATSIANFPIDLDRIAHRPH
jgi:ankyrin repeat protein